MKLYFYITRPEHHDIDPCFHASERELDIDDWLFVGTHDVDLDINLDQVNQHAVYKIDEQISKLRSAFQTELDSLETRKASLLALEHKS